jgi:serine kinase of HPr protein (carbohydrate metabolism regulator)
MELYGLGVLLAGPSGVGKSELALELLTRGHRLIADDASEFTRAADGALHGRCPPLLRGFLEARSLGILNVREMFGAGCLLESHGLDLVIRLEFRHDILARAPQPLERLEGRRSSVSLLGVEIPEVSIPIRLGHNLAVLVEAACRDLKLRQTGYRADEDLSARQLQAIKDAST